MSNPRPEGHMPPRTAMHAAQHKILNLLKTSCNFLVIMCCNVFSVWPKTTLLLSVAQRRQKVGPPCYRTSAVKRRSGDQMRLVVKAQGCGQSCIQVHQATLRHTCQKTKAQSNPAGVVTGNSDVLGRQRTPQPTGGHVGISV